MLTSAVLSRYTIFKIKKTTFLEIFVDVFFFVLIEYLSIPAVAPSSSEFETAALKTFEVNAEEMLSRQNLKQVSVTLRGKDGLKVSDISMVIASPTEISPLFKSKTMPDCRIPF